MENKGKKPFLEQEIIKITLYDGERIQILEVVSGSNLRKILLDEGISPYTRWTENLNCGGRGICATCGVWVEEKESDARHWHDRLAKRYGYPRLSCQIKVEQPMSIRTVDKVIWGKKKKD